MRGSTIIFIIFQYLVSKIIDKKRAVHRQTGSWRKLFLKSFLRFCIFILFVYVFFIFFNFFNPSRTNDWCSTKHFDHSQSHWKAIIYYYRFWKTCTEFEYYFASIFNIRCRKLPIVAKVSLCFWLSFRMKRTR